jgi:hypothetical protein
MIYTPEEETRYKKLRSMISREDIPRLPKKKFTQECRDKFSKHFMSDNSLLTALWDAMYKMSSDHDKVVMELTVSVEQKKIMAECRDLHRQAKEYENAVKVSGDEILGLMGRANRNDKIPLQARRKPVQGV